MYGMHKPMSVSICLLTILLTALTTFSITTSLRGRLGRISTSVIVALLAIGMSFFAYFLQPIAGSYTDLERIVEEIHLIQSGDLQQIIKAYSLNPLSWVYLWLVSLTGNVNLLKLISSFIIFLSISIIAYIEWASERLSNAGFILTILFYISCLNFPASVFGVRQGPSTALAILGAYLALVWTRKCGWIIMLVALLLHFGSIVILFAAIISTIKNRKIYISAFVLLLCYPAISYIGASQLATRGFSFATDLLSKMNGYYSFGDNYALFASQLSQFASIVRLCICVVILLFALRYGCRKDSSYASYTLFDILLIALCFGSFATSTPLRRFATTALYASLPLFAYAVSRFMRISAASSISETTMANIKQRHENGTFTYVYYALFLFLLCLCGFSLFYDWHSFENYYISTTQIYI